MSAVDCTVAGANPLSDVECNFKDARPVRLTSNDLVVSHYDRISVIEDVNRLSLYGKVGTFLVIRIAVLELAWNPTAQSPSLIMKEMGSGGCLPVYTMPSRIFAVISIPRVM